MNRSYPAPGQSRSRTRNRSRGTLMLLLLLALAFGGIAALTLLPSVAIQTQRREELDLRQTLSRFRQAFDIKQRYDPSFPPPTMNATQALAALVSERLLSASDTPDSSIPSHLWNIGSNTWQLGENIAYHSSFEAQDRSSDPTGLVSSWTKSQEVSWGLATQFFPTRDSPEPDDYPGQNRMGQILESSGSSLMIQK